MNCNDINILINKRIDGTINQLEEVVLEDHIKTCPSCKEELEDLLYLNEIMADSELVSLPEGFEEELKVKLEKAVSNIEVDKKSNVLDFNKTRKANITNIAEFMSRHKKGLASVAAVFMVGVLTFSTLNDMKYMDKAQVNVAFDTAVTRSMDTDTNYLDAKVGTMEFTEDMAVESAMADSPETSVYGITTTTAEPGAMSEGATSKTLTKGLTTDHTSNNSVPDESSKYSDQRMIIKNGYMHIEVLDYDFTVNMIKDQVNTLGGYVSNMSTSENGVYSEDKGRYLKSGYITIRVPQTSFDGVFGSFNDYGYVANSSVNTEDITDRYRSISDEVLNLEVREERLRDIMSKAVDVKDIIEVERELSRVRGEINSYKGTLKNWEKLVDLSTINIEIREVKTLNKDIRPVDSSLTDKAKYALIARINQLIDILEALVIGIVGVLPVLAILVIVWIVIYIPYKKRKRKQIKEQDTQGGNNHE